MANGNQTPDLETQFPTGGFLGGDQQAQTPTPQAAPQAAPQAPAAQSPMAQDLSGLHSLISGIQGDLQGGLGQQQAPIGQQVQQRHGGLLTGLAGVLLDGLASGMAPNAQMAYQIPMMRQQQQMQMQNLQLQQQKMQEEMREAPVREKLLLADTQMKLMQLDHAMQEMSEENQLGISDFQKKWVEKALSENRGEEVMEGTTEDVNKWMQENVHNPDIMKMIPYPKQRDASGKVSRVALVKINPEAMSDPIDRTLDLVGADGKPITIPVKVGAGPTAWQNAAALDIIHGAVALQTTELKPESPAQGLMQAVKKAQAAGKSGQAVFDDPDVQAGIKLIQATEKPGGGFESEAYQQYAQGEQAKGKQPLSMVDFQRRLWPQTVIAAEHAAIAAKGEARKETEAANWIPGSSGMMKNKASLAENVSQNSNAVAQILMRRPDILGIVQGRISAGKTMFGTNDPDLTSVGTAIHNIAIASQGIHGMRSPEEVARFEQKLFNNFKNGRKATVAALLENARSVQTFIDDARPETYRTHSRNGGALRTMTGQVSATPEVLTEESPEQ